MEGKINFLGLKKYTAWISGIFLIGGLILYLIKGGFRYGIDFGGGSQVTVKIGENVNIQKLRETIDINEGVKIIQLENEKGHFLIRVYLGQKMEMDSIKKLVESELINELKKKFGDIKINGLEYEDERVSFGFKSSLDKLDIDQVRNVLGGGIGVIEGEDNEMMIRGSFNELILMKEVIKPLRAGFKDLEIEGITSYSSTQGDVLKQQAWLLSVFVLALILIYIGLRFRLSFGVASIVALVHDIMIVLGLILILDREMETIVVISILTIIGYSLNDTIVIFDRIRENSQILSTKDYSLLINQSIYQSLRRTLVTSITTLFVVLCIWIWGGPTLENLALTLMIGIFVGTYSSIFIASPVLMIWETKKEQKEKNKLKNKGLKKETREIHG